ncbi:MAG: ADP-glyceromanno-heptose 6-epimerase [Chitinophagaceae bacterium]|nr:ADP-glyceromanno-heptose 6-epimerase [Chitinophagaceae bacterium]
MSSDSNILITGAAGFIGSYLLGYLNRRGIHRIIIADDFTKHNKLPNYQNKQYLLKINRDELFDYLKQQHPDISFVFHLGARTDTTEFDYSVHRRLNLEYSQQLWNFCVFKKIPFIYASSAATYGTGEEGYNDDHEIIPRLKPLNPYGRSKHEFDLWVLRQNETPPAWAGLKFFNVYGPNEYHKGRMASMVFHGFHQIHQTGKVRLFRSHRPDFPDGGQKRDFIYVNDIARVCEWMMTSMLSGNWNVLCNGIYNLGTGQARTFYDLEKAVFDALNKPVQIEYFDIPEDIRNSYQYFTEAKMQKLRSAGYQAPFTLLEEGVIDYVLNFLLPEKYF